MYSERLRLLMLLPILLPMLLLGLSTSATAATPTTEMIKFKLTPDTCVALQQGRLCYATINIQWQTDKPQDVCLHAGTEKLQCWQASSAGHLRYEFVATDSQPLQLINADGILAESVIKVNWVQKNPKVKRHWRLF
jgi:hypothetical protein